MSRLNKTFKTLRREERTGLVTYVTAGDPTVARTESILRTLDASGADVLEIGVPFSDPLADGPVIQRASERALAAGSTLTSTLTTLEKMRSSLEAPIVIFTYVNPILSLGLDEFGARAAAAGIDGVLVLDLPVEEGKSFFDTMSKVEIDTIGLISPTTTTIRMKETVKCSRGFLYGISRLGVTGVRTELSQDAEALVQRIRTVSDMPVALGFGISSPEHIREVGRWADAAVVGSGLVSVIAEFGESVDLEDRVGRYISWLISDGFQKRT